MGTVSVSIALATFNGERFLRRQLESLAWQTQPPDELIVTDDCSTDRTVAILREFSQSAPFPVRVTVNESSLNFRANFLKAANLCSSQIILFCDQDDVWRPEKIAVIAREFANDPSLLLSYHNATIVDAQERSLGVMFDSAEQKTILERDLPPPWHFARGLVQGFRRELLAFDDLWPLSREHFDGERLGHDRWYFLLALAARRVSFIDEDLLMYRQHGANTFGADRQLGWRGRLYERIRHYGDGDTSAAKGARSRVEVLRALELRVAPENRRQVARLVNAYADYAGRLERRAHTFDAASRAARMIALTRSLARGDYCGNPWGFDPRSVLRDALLGVGGFGR